MPRPKGSQNKKQETIVVDYEEKTEETLEQKYSAYNIISIVGNEITLIKKSGDGTRYVIKDTSI